MEAESKRVQDMLEKSLSGELSPEELQAMLDGERGRAKNRKGAGGPGGPGGDGGGAGGRGGRGGAGGAGGGRRGGAGGAGGDGYGGADGADGFGGAGGRGGRYGGGSGQGKDVAVQAGPSMLGSGGGGGGGGGGGMDDDRILSNAGGAAKSTEMPSIAVTSLCEIKFNRKDVKHMNVLMCRRLVAALYQVRVENNKADDKEARFRQRFADFVPDQFVVLYGIKSLAIKNINEFLYGVRKQRTRHNAKQEEENEPVLHIFWQASQHGVPDAEKMHADDFDFYIDLLGELANCVGAEHTLKMKGVGAFWNLFGSMAEMELPVFVLLNTCQKFCNGRKHPQLFEKLKSSTITMAKAYTKAAKGPNPPKPPPSYKSQLVGNDGLDSRGYLNVDQWLRAALDIFRAQRDLDGKALVGIFQTWVASLPGASQLEQFSAMLTHAKSDITERQVLEFFARGTGADDEVNMEALEYELRRNRIFVKAKPQPRSITETANNKVDSMHELSVATKAAGLFNQVGKGGLASLAGAAKSQAADGAGDSQQPTSPSADDEEAAKAAKALKAFGGGSSLNLTKSGKWGKAATAVVTGYGMIRSLLAGLPGMEDVAAAPSAVAIE
jgi:hypothetical protein